MAFRRNFSNLINTRERIEEIDKILAGEETEILVKVVRDLQCEAYNNGGIAKWAALFVRELQNGTPYEDKRYLWYNDFADNTYVPVTKKAIELLEKASKAPYAPAEEGNWKDCYFDVLNQQQQAEVFEWLDAWIHGHNHEKAICRSLVEYLEKYIDEEPEITKKTYEILDHNTAAAVKKLKFSCSFNKKDKKEWLQLLVNES